jgi:hypothetical protein
LATVTITANGSRYTSNPTFVPNSGTIGTSTTAFSSCSNTSNGDSYRSLASTASIPVLLVNNIYRIVFQFSTWTTASGSPFIQIRLVDQLSQVPLSETAVLGPYNYGRGSTMAVRVTASGANATTVLTQLDDDTLPGSYLYRYNAITQPMTWPAVNHTLSLQIQWNAVAAGLAVRLMGVTIYQDN